MNIKPNVQSQRHYVATLLLEEWKDDNHTLEVGTWESTRTPETSKFDYKGQNTLH
jgi:hypothetical protein